MKFLTKEVQIALVAIVGIVVLFLGLSYLKGLNLFSNEHTYYIKFSDVNGLSSSSPVYAHGVRVGVVKDIVYDFDKDGEIVAVIGLDNRMKLPLGTNAFLDRDMLGNIKVSLNFPESMTSLLTAGDTIQGSVNSGLMDKAAQLLPVVEKMLPKIDSILTSVNTLMADPAWANSLHNAEKVTADLSTSTRQLNTLMTQLNREVPVMVTKANTVLDNTGELTGKLNAIDYAATMAKVDATLDNVHQMTETLNSKKGTLGLLMNDPGLYHRLNATVMLVDSLLIDFQDHPRRYIHLSVF